MKGVNKRYWKYLCLLMLLVVSKMPAQENTIEEWRYDIECAGVGGASEGTYLVRVWTYTKKPKNLSSNEMKKNAVHGVLFKGFSGEMGCTSQKPLVSSASTYFDKGDFFRPFFSEGGGYLKYANMVSSSLEIIKLKKNEYKVGAVFSVSKDMLRKDLENAGVIRSLSSGF